MSRFTVQIDESLCAGYGSCIEVSPELFELNDDGVAVMRFVSTDDARVYDAARACPMDAITVVEVQAA